MTTVDWAGVALLYATSALGLAVLLLFGLADWLYTRHERAAIRRALQLPAPWNGKVTKR